MDGPPGCEGSTPDGSRSGIEEAKSQFREMRSYGRRSDLSTFKEESENK